MQITIIYATYSNSTAIACEDLKAELEKLDHLVTLAQISDIDANELTKLDFFILASPSWDYNGAQGMPHEDFYKFHQTNPQLKLSNSRFAVMGLGDASFTFFCGATEHLSQWFTEYGAKPIIDPLKIDNYYLNEQQAKVQIADWAKNLDSKLK